MANVKTLFFGTDENQEHQLEVFVNRENELYIEITDGGSFNSYITLDKSTAIKLVKVMKTEISKIQQ